MSRHPLQKRHRELLQALQPTMDELGVSLLEISRRGSGHLRFHLDLGGGVTGNLGVANSPSCPRNTENVRRNLRQLVQENRVVPLRRA